VPKRKRDTGRAADSLEVLTQPHAQVELCGRIISGAMAHMERYIRRHPEWASDDRSRFGQEMFQLWVGEVCEMIGEYQISYRDDNGKRP
jgi:hypothetical protein